MQQYDHNGKFRIAYPEDWTVENSEGIIELQRNENPLGVLQFSVLYPPEGDVVVLRELLAEFAEDYTTDYIIKESQHFAYTDYFMTEEKMWWKFWTIRKDHMVIFATYGCEKEEWRGKEDQIVDEIIASINIEL